METLTSSETFANDAASGSLVYAADPAIMPVRRAAQAAATIAYDLATQGYSVFTEGRGQTFLPSHLNSTLSNANVAVYERTNATGQTAATTSDSLTLTRPGNSGANYRYVAGGFWQHTDILSQSGTFDAFAYGLATTNAATPRTGQGGYAVNLITARSDVWGVSSLLGEGSAQVDFSTGLVLTQGYVGSSQLRFTGQGQLSSSNNGFGGNFTVVNTGGSDFWTLRGRWDGRFFGPAAEEFGAAFSAMRDDGMDMMVGVLLGRRGPQSATNTSIRAMTTGSFLENDAASVKASITTVSGPGVPVGVFSGRSQGPKPLVVSYDSLSLTYTLITPDRTLLVGQARDTRLPSLDMGDSAPSDLYSDLSYVAASSIRLGDETSGVASHDRTYFAYGLATPAAATPRTGSGGYVIYLGGLMADSDFPGVLNLRGDGVLTANFATGAITGDGRVRYSPEYYSGVAAPVGDFNLSGTMSSTTNGFSGAMNFDGVGGYNATFNGRFYGPAAQEVGAAFSGSDGAGGVLAGALIGRADASVLDPLTPLYALTSRTEFSARQTWGHSNLDGTGGYAAYDPTTQTFVFENLGPTLPPWYPLGPAQRDASRSNATVTAYSGVGGPPGWGGVPYTGAVFNTGPGNPKLELSYSSFANVNVPALGVSANTYRSFGIATPLLQMPRSGTAEYAGIVVGSGDVAGDAVSVDGVAAMSANFGASTYTARLNLVTISDIGAVSTTLPERTYSGTIMGVNFQGPAIRGAFYGPNAREFGAVFVDGGLYGVIAGKRGP